MSDLIERLRHEIAIHDSMSDDVADQFRNDIDEACKEIERLEAELEKANMLARIAAGDYKRLREALEQAEAKIEAQAEYIMTANRVNNNLKKQLEE